MKMRRMKQEVQDLGPITSVVGTRHRRLKDKQHENISLAPIQSFPQRRLSEDAMIHVDRIRSLPVAVEPAASTSSSCECPAKTSQVTP